MPSTLHLISVRRRRLLLALSAVPLPWLAHAAPSKDAIVVGQSAPLSGAMAPFMAEVLTGQRVAFSDFNQAGGLDGRPIELTILDDGFNPQKTLENAKTLVEQHKAIALMGTVGTAQTAAVLPYIVEKRVPLISAYTGSPALRIQANPYFFTTQASYADEIGKMVRNLVTIQCNRIAVVYQDNEFGQLLKPLVEKMIVAGGATVAASHALEAKSGADAVEVTKKLAEARPQGIIMIAAGPPVVAYIKANKALLGVPVYTFSLSVGVAIVKALGNDARGLAVTRATPYPWRATNPLARRFQAAMERAGKPIDYDHYVGYINAQVVIEGLRAAGKDPSSASLRNAMENLGRLDLGGYVLNYSPENHHGSNFVEITVVGQDGQFLR